MSDLIGTIPYENISRIRAMCDGLPCAGNRFANQILVIVEFIETPGLERNERIGSFVTLETSQPGINGIYPIKSVRDSEGYRAITIDLSKADMIVKKTFTGIDLGGVSGQIFFGKRTTGGSTGGTVSQILNTDAGKVIGAGVLAIAAIILLRYLIKD